MGNRPAADGADHGLLSADPLALTDENDIVRFVSVSGLELLGYTSDELVGRAVVGLVHPDDRTRAQHANGAANAHGTTMLRYRCKDGSYASVGSINQAVDTSLTGVLLETQMLLREMGQLKNAQATIERQALTDALTGLANRTLLADRLSQGVRHLERRPGFVGVLMLDLDHFKVINDTLGHQAGDEVLVQTAQRLQHLARPEDTVARFGGDEFVLVVLSLTDPADLVAFADRVIAGLRAPYRIQGEDVVVTVSVGIAVAAQPDNLPADLLREADLAMYRAKDQGRDRHEVYGVALQVRATERLQTERALRSALANDLLRVEYQPIVDVVTGTTVGAEALLRFDNAEGAHVTPADYLNVAQEAGLLPALDERVRAKSFADFRRWRDRPACHGIRRLGVNLTARELANPNFAAQLASSIEAAGLVGTDLSIELTEHVLLQTSHSAVASLAELRKNGIHIGLDDFGTGFSALSYLQTFPIDFLKIDRSFIEKIAVDRRSAAITAAIVDLAHALGLYTVAEGVDDADQLRQLRTLGCDLAQGFFFSPSICSADFVNRLDGASVRGRAARGSDQPSQVDRPADSEDRRDKNAAIRLVP